MSDSTHERCWINAPSTLNQYNNMHGLRVIAPKKRSGDERVTVYFIDGQIISAMVHQMYLSKGWPKGA